MHIKNRSLILVLIAVALLSAVLPVTALAQTYTYSLPQQYIDLRMVLIRLITCSYLSMIPPDQQSNGSMLASPMTITISTVLWPMQMASS